MEEQENQGGLIYSENSVSNLRCCISRAAYTLTALQKSGWYVDTTYLNEKTQIIPNVLPFKRTSLTKQWQGHKVVLPGLRDFNFNAPKEIINGMAGYGSDPMFDQKISKTFLKSGEEKGVNYVFPVDWINPKVENKKVTS